MFALQQFFSAPTVHCTREVFYAIVRDQRVKNIIAQAREANTRGDRKEYYQLKKGLPCFCFMATFEPNNSRNGKLSLNMWRLQSAVHLNGLIMHDFDHLSQQGLTPRQVFEAIPDHWKDATSPRFRLMLAHTTVGGDGLRLVTTALPDYNIADNQQAVATALSTALGCPLVADESCKNADRTSFAVGEDDFYFIDEDIFTYNNEDYNAKFADFYHKADKTRKAKAPKAPPTAPEGASIDWRAESIVSPSGDALDLRSLATEGTQERGAVAGAGSSISPSSSYHGLTYAEILSKWHEQNGTPTVGDRHKTALRLADDLRYICDNNPKSVLTLMMSVDWFKTWHEEEPANAEGVINDSCERKLWWGTPKRLKAVMEALGIGTSPNPSEGGEQEGPDVSVYESIWRRLKPLMSSPYTEACYEVSDLNKLGAIFASGTMFCTLLTRCTYNHYDGREHRMNPQTFIIGDPASGKGAIDRIDRMLMEPVVAADRQGREAEAAYKEEQRERATSSKAQRGDALKRPTFPIRYLPSKTSNAIFFRRQKNAVEETDGNIMPLHLYTFDSELDANTVAQNSGSWIGKHDIELKAFHNEYTGVDYANSDSVNDIIQVFYNTVATGTPNSLSKKLNLRNINDGYCTRLAIFRMLPERFRMLSKANKVRMHELECAARQWAYKFDQQRGRMNIDRLVQHSYELCEQSAFEAEASSDTVLDYLRKRAVFYAVWFTVPRIAARGIDAGQAPEQWTVEDSDLQFASLIYDAILYWQDYYFGSLLQEAWTNAAQEYKPRRKNTANAAAYARLPEVFTREQVADCLGISENAARVQLQRWREAGAVEKTDEGKFKKIVSAL